MNQCLMFIFVSILIERKIEWEMLHTAHQIEKRIEFHNWMIIINNELWNLLRDFIPDECTPVYNLTRTWSRNIIDEWICDLVDKIKIENWIYFYHSICKNENEKCPWQPTNWHQMACALNLILFLVFNFAELTLSGCDVIRIYNNKQFQFWKLHNLCLPFHLVVLTKFTCYINQ